MPPTTMTHADAAAAVCPGFTHRGALSGTGGMALLDGSTPAGRAVAKRPGTAEEAEVAKLRREIATYARFAELPPPVTVPRVLGADAALPVLVLEYVTTTLPVGADHRPFYYLPEHIDMLLGALSAVATWQGATTTALERDYQRELECARWLGLVSPEEYGVLAVLLAQVAERYVFSHGSPTAAHALMTADGIAMLSWARAGLRLPGDDLASAWCALYTNADARAQIEHAAATGPQEIRLGFAACRALELARVIHRVLGQPDCQLREDALALLAADAATSRLALKAMW